MSKQRRRPVLAVFASGGGTTFRAVAEAVAEGLADFDIKLLITNHADAGVLEHVRAMNRQHGMNIKTMIVNKKRYPNGEQGRGQTREEGEAVIEALIKNRIDHLALMGCTRILAPQLIDAYGWKPEYAKQDPEYKGIYLARMSNTHPGILPETTDTYGLATQSRVLDLGLKETAHTVHVVAAGVDEGPVIAEHRVRAFAPGKYPKDLADTPESLFARVRRIEKAHLPLDLDAFLKNQALFQQHQ
jgi:folate-dependent phosphoribosylglycinamide formyltransferase PurN